MGELHTELGAAVAAAMGDDARQRRLAVIRVEPEAAMSDAATALDAGGLDHDQRGAGIGEHAEMVEVPVVGDAVVGAVLAHGRDDDPVRELEIGEPDRRKQGTGHVTRIDLGERSGAAGSIGNGAASGQAVLRQRRFAAGSGGRAAGRGGNGLLGRGFLRRRRNLSPSLAHLDRVAHAIEELLLAVIMLPAPAVVQLEKMGLPTLGQGAPFVRDLVECMRG